ncbi:peptidase S41 [Helicobacter sp. CLO-3]|uniref:S41 family peptidase n=1 Tax=unclassified Helicobacter TaxID=2593540 RepID=UPI000805EBB5|nr:S41 family peptidase [Helicobacter sp. CLO-3]OBV30065.1 peptidase S41 [Helicobacter sp. CLO-3]OHU82700.1 peptidase S41 [Helicobacter sp. CLO-3]
MSRNFLFGIGIAFLWVFLTTSNLTALTQGSPKAPAVDSKKQRAQAYDRLAKTIATIEAYYVDEVGIDDIIDKAIDGLIANLDAHSAYLNEKKYKELKTQTDGEFGGLGITVGIKDGALTVIAPLDDTPAQKAGLKSGDVILKIEDQSTIGMNIDDAVNLMRGKPKTAINITIVRKGEGKPLEFKLVRDIIKVKSVYAKAIDDTPYLYVRINSFDKNVTESVKQALKEHSKIKGLVLDLRNNPGGLLDQAVDLSNLFIKEGIIVSQKGKLQEENIVYKANGRAPYAQLPIAVLVNAGTASASEIVAGALQDHSRAIIIGEDTFGKGSVQVVIPINTTEAIKLTTAKYYLPSGRTIQAVGVSPDIIVYPGSVPHSESGFEIKEADLRNHLQNELKKIENKDNKDTAKASLQEAQKSITHADVSSDIQLKSAIDALKAWAILDTAKKPKDAKANAAK